MGFNLAFKVLRKNGGAWILLLWRYNSDRVLAFSTISFHLRKVRGLCLVFWRWWQTPETFFVPY
jgi:hypothetical protein